MADAPAQAPASQRGFSVADLFRPAPKTAPAASTPAPQQGATIPGTGMPTTPNNPGADPATVTGTPDPTKTSTPSNPLDNFKDIFTITEDDKKNAPPNPFAEPLLNFDGKKFGETVGRMNFAGSLNPEVVTKALGGDAQAFSTALNHVSQATFTAMAQVFSGILEQAVKKNNSRWDGALDSKFRSLQLQNQRSTNPALQHPAVQPMLEALKTTIASKNPSLHPTEVTSKAEEYFGAISDAIMATKTKVTDDKKTTAEPDWTKFLEGIGT